MKHKSTPIRQCLGCKKKNPKYELLRFVNLPSGQMIFDRTYCREGRGKYICPDKVCFDLASRGKFIPDYMRSKEKRSEFFHLVRAELAQTIRVHFDRIREIYFAGEFADYGKITQGDIVIIADNFTKTDIDSISTMALCRGAEIYQVPGHIHRDKHAYIFKADYFLRSQLIHDLRMLERLSSKGLTV